MTRVWRALGWLAVLAPGAVSAQIDPVKRDLIQFGYNQPVEGRAPVAGYAYYYHNQPDFLRTNVTLRLAVAPTYVDSEFGFNHGLGPNTDFALGLAGGGFADSYNEISGGKWVEAESFDGHGVEASASVYHRFNPADQIPLNFVLHTGARGSFFEAGEKTAPDFQPPDDLAALNVRTGLRYGGMEPTLFPDLAMELAVWYEGEFRTTGGAYGFNGDRELEPSSHLFWTSAALCYTLPNRQNIFIRMMGGTSVSADRLSAYRLGGFLPLISEYPLSLPGYYYQEFTARDFVLLNASYTIPIAPDDRWSLELNGATAGIHYLAGTEQVGPDETGNWVSGVGAGLLYRSPSDRIKVILNYAYGIDAVRDTGRGASSVGVLIQVDLGKLHSKDITATQPNRWRGWNWLLGR